MAIEAQGTPIGDVFVAPLNWLQIDDVLVQNKSDHIVLDVRMRNTAQETVNITRADLHILSRMPYMAAYQASASYDLIVEGEHNVIPVGHVLNPR